MSNPRRVLLVSTSYPSDAGDWKGRFISDMVDALSRAPDVSLSGWFPPGQAPENMHYCATPEEAQWLHELVASGGIAHVIKHRPYAAPFYMIGLLRRLRSAYRRMSDVDVIHVNWLQNALPLIGSSKPALITVLGTDFALLRIPGMARLLRMALRNRPCVIAPNSSWMVPKLRLLFGDIAEVRAIPFGIEDAWFNIERSVPHSQDDEEHWIVVSRVTRAKIGHLLSWGEGLFGPHRQLHLLGPMQEEMSLPPWITYHGPTNPTQLQSHWFPRANGLISLSTHSEGRPQVMLEAMASGLPIIASSLPAHADLLQHERTGMLVETRSQFEQALQSLSAPSTSRRIGQAARDYVRHEVGTWDDCAERYATAYRSLTDSARHGS